MRTSGNAELSPKPLSPEGKVTLEEQMEGEGRGPSDPVRGLVGDLKNKDGLEKMEEIKIKVGSEP